MSCKTQNPGFSLTEMLLAIGVLSVGMVFIAGVFPVAIHFMTISTERTIAAVVADEAFAKIKLYAHPDPAGPDTNEIQLGLLTDLGHAYFRDPSIFPVMAYIDPNEEFMYPSTDTDVSQKHYCFSALCRLTGPGLVQVTVFICRKTGPILRYYTPDMTLIPSDPDYGVVDFSGAITVDWPRPVKVAVVADPVKPNEIHIVEPKERMFINDGCRIVDNATGRIYRVMERYAPPNDNIILLDGDWQVGSDNNVWVVPPPTGAGRYPCIAIYQKEIRF